MATDSLSAVGQDALPRSQQQEVTEQERDYDDADVVNGDGHAREHADQRARQGADPIAVRPPHQDERNEHRVHHEQVVAEHRRPIEQGRSESQQKRELCRLARIQSAPAEHAVEEREKCGRDRRHEERRRDEGGGAKTQVETALLDEPVEIHPVGLVGNSVLAVGDAFPGDLLLAFGFEPIQYRIENKQGDRREHRHEAPGSR